MKELEALSLEMHAKSPIVTLATVASDLGCEPGEILTKYFSDRAAQAKDVFDDSTDFAVWSRSAHVFGESLRVMSVATSSPTAEEFGKVMNDSHSSCRDLFECSCPELEELVRISSSCGAVGTRLTGAGWGGCNVSAVRVGEVDAFIDGVKEKVSVSASRSDELRRHVFGKLMRSVDNSVHNAFTVNSDVVFNPVNTTYHATRYAYRSTMRGTWVWRRCRRGRYA